MLNYNDDVVSHRNENDQRKHEKRAKVFFVNYFQNNFDFCDRESVIHE
jgi:hypothetical protein